MRILVTGASGFVGSAACTHLAESGHDLVRWAGPGTPSDDTTLSVDIADSSTFPDPEAVGRLDAVVHCAGIAHRFGGVLRTEFDRVNVGGVENAIRFAAGYGATKFVLISSVLVYGRPGTSVPITEEFPTVPRDEYGKSKLAAEVAAIRICSSAGIGLTILRPAPIIGEGSRGNVSRLIDAIARNRFFWIGDGRNERSFVYLGDVARAIGSSLSPDMDDAICNVVGDSVKVRHLVKMISDRVGKNVPKRAVPTWAARVLYHGSIIASPIPLIDRYRRTLDTWLADAVYSGDSIRQLNGFVAQTSIEEAIDREVDHYLRTK